MISPSDYHQLPRHHDEAFLAFEVLCRAEMKRAISALGQNDTEDEARIEYMVRVQSAAYEYEIEDAENLGIPSQNLDSASFFWFNQEVTRLVTRLNLRNVRRLAEDSLELDPPDRTKIKAEIERLKNRVRGAEGIDDPVKNSLVKKIEALLAEVDKPTLNLTKFTLAMAAVTAAFTALGSVQGAVIKGPETVVALLDMVHIVRGRDEERRALFERYRKPKAIEHTPEPTDDDDEIPF